MVLGRATISACLALALGLLVTITPDTLADVIADIIIEEEDEQTEQQGGFSIKKEDKKVIDALDDFNRYSEKKAWELAFRALGTAAESEGKGMLPAKDGFWVRVKQRMLRSLASLPPDGREAYRLFNDGKARQLMEQARNAENEADELKLLQSIVEHHFITAVGDDAADLLGDAYFASGDFLAADAIWDSILRHYPDTNLSLARLLVKRGTALARAGQREQAVEIRRALQSRFPGERMRIGGREVVADEYLAALIEPMQSISADPTRSDGAAIRLPQTQTPAWQLRFTSDAVQERIQAALNNMGWGRMMTGLTRVVPPAAQDEQRTYINWLGVCFSVDNRTGKLLWRTDKFTDVSGKANEMVNMLLDTKRYAATVSGDVVLFVRIPIKRLNYNEPFRLSCLVAETGKQKWSTESGALAQWSFLGTPLIVADTVYMTAHRQNTQELNLLAINIQSGKLEWSMILGTMQAGQDYRGQPQMAPPRLLHDGGIMYILTNNGALLAVSIPGRRIEWAFTFPAPPVVNQNMWWGGMEMRDPIAGPASIILSGGVLYVKESSGDAVYAIDPSSPSLKWRRPVSRSDTIVHTDGNRLFLIGEEAGAIDLQTRALLWSAKLPVETSATVPTFSDNSVFAFFGRGIYQLNLANGDTMTIFRGADKESLGGSLWATPHHLISVSNRAVTAYPLSGAQTSAR